MSVRQVDLGQVTAYAEAVNGGYTGTKEEFEADLGRSAENASAAALSADDAAESATSAQTAQEAAESARDTAISARDTTLGYKNTAQSASDTAVLSASAASVSEQNAADSAALAAANAGSIYVKDQRDSKTYGLEILVNTDSKLAIRLTEVEET